jgi:DMSO/TMAO reductase YedYZ molybdopterin-dependent catalytic subunit
MRENVTGIALTGVRLSRVLDAFHPRTILANGMNDRNLPIPHGGEI